ncbi:MAG: hypothetical protein MUF77_10225 [Leptospira sp.]|nr:hypothetical protein [Leptospira sp.]
MNEKTNTNYKVSFQVNPEEFIIEHSRNLSLQYTKESREDFIRKHAVDFVEMLIRRNAIGNSLLIPSKFGVYKSEKLEQACKSYNNRLKSMIDANLKPRLKLVNLEGVFS